MMKAAVRIMWLVVFLIPFAAVHAQENVQAGLEAFIAEIAPEDGPAVAVSITIGDQKWMAAGGLVDVTGTTTATAGDAFRIASISKTWLAVVVMQLRDEGKLSLSDAARDWLPDAVVTALANADQATIQQLLTMTSGIPEYLNDDFFNAVAENTAATWTPEEVLGFAHGLPASFAPGEGFEYSNSNYVLLQVVVEAVTGQPMHAVMRERIFEPLGLDDTYVQIQESGSPFVHGYEDFDGDGEAEDVTDYNDGAGLGDGALISTVSDITRFYQALFVEHSLLSENSVQEMIDAGRNDDQYGIGLEVYEDESGLMIGHTGAVLGFTGAVYYAADLDAVIVILYGSDGMDEAHIERLVELAEGVEAD
ncbi:MAG: beta-lactamase family protein [Chloroflexi bacterium]|nr:beta-lactamase family protein [Chloroflexota bacterium]MCC6894993.1 beta-lactamase family protein [Anaerolineae bacterium]